MDGAAWASVGNSRRGIPAKSGNEPLAETAWLSSGAVISACWPLLAAAHPMGKLKSREPGGEGLAGWETATRSLRRAAQLTWSHKGHSDGPWLPGVRLAQSFIKGVGLLWVQLPDHGAVLSSEWLGKVGTYGIPTGPGRQVSSRHQVTVLSWSGQCCPLSPSFPRGRPLLWLFCVLSLQPWVKPQTPIGGLHH